MAIGACCILILLPWAWQIKLLSVCFIVISAIYAVCRYGLLMLPWSCVALHINSKNDLQLIRKDGKAFNVTAQANSVVTSYLTVLNCLLVNQDQLSVATYCKQIFLFNITHYSLVILPDALEAESYRQLRVWMRWGYK